MTSLLAARKAFFDVVSWIAATGKFGKTVGLSVKPAIIVPASSEIFASCSGNRAICFSFSIR